MLQQSVLPLWYLHSRIFCVFVISMWDLLENKTLHLKHLLITFLGEKANVASNKTHRCVFSGFTVKVVFLVRTVCSIVLSTFLCPQSIVQHFLVLLINSSDESLRFLSFRLDFNEHYRCSLCFVCFFSVSHHLAPS